MSEQHDYREVSDPAVMAIQPLVSVHMLAYRHEKFLAEAIEGVVAQVCDFPIELIIAEDCSPDRTLAIALDYQRRYPALIRIITGDKNVGMHANAARSMAVVRGKYVALCEGDDYWHYPQKLQMQVDAMRLDPQITLCHTDYDRQIGFRIKRSCNQRGYTRPAASYLDLLLGYTIKTATEVVAKDGLVAFGQSGLNNPDWPFGDYTHELFLSTKGKVCYIATSTAVSRKVIGSAMNSGPEKALKMALGAQECQMTFLAYKPVSDLEREKVLRASNIRIMKSAINALDMQAYSLAYENLKRLNAQPNDIMNAFRRSMMRLAFPIKILLGLKYFVAKLTTEAL